MMGREKEYIYFQDFIPGNDYDTRVTIIGDRARLYKKCLHRLFLELSVAVTLSITLTEFSKPAWKLLSI